MKIVVGGQIDKEEIAKIVSQLMNGKAEIEIRGDLDGAMGVKEGKYDYYVGACNTGGGGALAMALALLGSKSCSTISMPGQIKSEAFIREEVEKGKKAFGFTAQHKDEVLPVLLKAICEKEGV
ncbi:uncharacterized protein DUF2620 [Lacrimispora xylanisolvens]|uniref:Uncharacterized protein DUF2620 n=1 Tax=Lacrimispora xylanisolvens TaxID=384636 RepID=A0A2S6HRF2_9FIRM|nr:DUF2620 domain-containing protein [Hungatella xylanolytica]PPK80097.1 uncharacterized protein DUF2620 [Hungatella xylanolytica]